MQLLGGIAAISPVEEPVAERVLGSVPLLANDIEPHMFMASELYVRCIFRSPGLINIDINVVTGNFIFSTT